MNRKLYFILFFLGLFSNYANCQKSDLIYDKEVFPFLSLNVGKFAFGNVGVCLSGMTLKSGFPSSYNLYVANEIKIGNNLLIGPKIGGWLSFSFLAAGMSFIYYSDFHTHTFAYRPEIGVEFKRFKFTYGYNLKLDNKPSNIINLHLGELTYNFRRRVFFQLRSR